MRVFWFSKPIIRHFGSLDTHPCFQGSGFGVRGVVAASPQIIYGATPEDGIQVTGHQSLEAPNPQPLIPSP